MQAHILSLHYSVLAHILNPQDGSKGQKIFFLKLVMLDIKIEGNEAWSTIQAHFLSLHTPSAPGEGSKGQTFFF